MAAVGFSKRSHSAFLNGRRIGASASLVFFLLALPPREASAQENRPPPSRQHGVGTPLVTTTYSSSELDRSTRQLPINFKGNDIVSVAGELLIRQGASEKSEFETKAAWQERLAKLRSKPILGRMTVDSTWTFPLETVTSVYDADEQSLDVYVPLYHDDLHAEVGTTTRRVLGSRSDSKTTHHIASNASGVRVRVTESYLEFYSLAVENWSGFALAKDRRPVIEGGGQDSIYIKLPSEPSQARRLKEKIAGLALCHLVEPFVIVTNDEVRPTISRPFQSHESGFFLTVRLAEVWIYDRSSGIVLSKLVPKS